MSQPHATYWQIPEATHLASAGPFDGRLIKGHGDTQLLAASCWAYGLWPMSYVLWPAYFYVTSPGCWLGDISTNDILHIAFVSKLELPRKCALIRSAVIKFDFLIAHL
jgi:hypothetical protein